VLVPAIPLMLLAGSFFRIQRVHWLLALIYAAFVVLLPRLVRFANTTWLSAPAGRSWLKSVPLGLAALFLGSLFYGFGLVISLGFLGLAVQAPTPDLGGIVLVLFRFIVKSPGGLLYPAAVIWICTFAFYIATDAMLGYFNSKQPLTRLNE
jgi:hypothetical protein